MKAKAIFNKRAGPYDPAAPDRLQERLFRMLRSQPVPHGVAVALVVLLGSSPFGCGPGEDRERLLPEGGPPVPLIFAFQPQENPEGLAPGARELANYLGEVLETPTEVFLPTTYAAVVEAMRSGHADVAYLSGWPYLTAHREAGAEILVVEERNGNPFYQSQWFVRADDDVESLADLRGRSVAFPSPSSTSGYLFPVARLVEEGLLKTGEDPKVFFGQVLFAGGYEQALQALAAGSVDAAAAADYAFEMYLDETQRARVRVLTQQGPVPTHGLAVRGSVPPVWKERIRDALLTLNEPEQRERLRSVYGAERLVPRTHEEHVASLLHARRLLGLEDEPR